MPLLLVTGPSVEPVTAEESWAHLRVPLFGSPAVPADATDIALRLKAAREHVERVYLGRALVEQTWDYVLDGFPAGRNSQTGYRGSWARTARIDIPMPPLRSVTSITYVDELGATQTLSSALYTVDTASDPGAIVMIPGEVWPSTRDQVNAVTIRFVAGYASSGSPPDYRANSPSDIKVGLLMVLTDMYENRSSETPIQNYKVNSDAAWWLSNYQTNGGFE